MTSGRGVLAVVIPILLLLLVGSQSLFGWIPAKSGTISPWRILSAAMAVYLLYLAMGVDTNRLSHRLRKTTVSCLRCGQVTGVAAWEQRGRCPACGHQAYEYQGAKGLEYAQFLPGAVVLDPPAPPAAEPTPVAQAPCPVALLPRGPRGEATTRLGIGARRRVKDRLSEVMVDRRNAPRV